MLGCIVASLGCSAGPAEGRVRQQPGEARRPAALAAVDTADEPLILIVGPARTALDSANALFKSKRYGHALASYRTAARLAPEEPAPLLGMLMAANMLKDERLADSVQAAIRSQSSRTRTPAPKG